MARRSGFALASILFGLGVTGTAHANTPLLTASAEQIRFFDSAGHPEPQAVEPESASASDEPALPLPPQSDAGDNGTGHVHGLLSFLPPAKNTPESEEWADHVPSADTPYRSFGSKVGRVKWEMLGLLGYFTIDNSDKLFKPTEFFHFENEGWFGKSTLNLGVDKLAHAFNSYQLAEFLHARLHRKTDGASGDAFAASVLASSVMIYGELWDAIEKDGGFSIQDVTANTLGSAFSLLRNTVPGLRDKLDFRMLYMPGADIYTRVGKRHFEEQRFLLALQLSGFKQFRNTPLRLVELHAGYYASNFTDDQRARGEIPQRHLFFGVGLNVRELLFRNPTSTIGRVAGTALDYYQIPYTAAHWDSHAIN